MKWIKKDNHHILKEGRRIKGFCFKLKYGYAYSFGKPSNNSNLSFSSNKKPYTLEECKTKLLNQVKKTDSIINQIIHSKK